MKALFRVDASIEIGTGHVMRCLTLADALAARGVHTTFVCRSHCGHLGEVIVARGHGLRLLGPGRGTGAHRGPVHAGWLGASQAEDAAACIDITRAVRPDWLIVDHYGLDERWESAIRPSVGRIMAIDDLADRNHDCDLLLDQNLGRDVAAYVSRIPAHAEILAGPGFALLRPEFARRREACLARRTEAGPPRSILIALGGIDKDNFATLSLELLGAAGLPTGVTIVVVLGASPLWLDEVRTAANRLPWAVEVLTYTDRMADLMANADLAIGASGASTWERCCLGLPAGMWVVADNQTVIASAVAAAGAGALLDRTDLDASARTLKALVGDPKALGAMSRRAAGLVDGRGVERVLARMGFPDGQSS